jgi:hypothetical protein
MTSMTSKTSKTSRKTTTTVTTSTSKLRTSTKSVAVDQPGTSSRLRAAAAR